MSLKAQSSRSRKAQLPSGRDLVFAQALMAVKQARDKRAPLSVSDEIERILSLYPDCTLTPDELARAILRFCTWERVPATNAEVALRRTGAALAR